MSDQEELTFREVQRFGLWLRLFSVVSILFAVGIAGFGLATDGAKEPVAMVGSAGLILLLLATAGVFFVLRLETEVHTDSLYFRFFPIHIRYKKIGPEELSESYARRYRPIVEYGGWGIRWGFKGGRAYNISGNEGVQLVFKDGRRLLIGSQKADELAAAISAARHGKSEGKI